MNPPVLSDAILRKIANRLLGACEYFAANRGKWVSVARIRIGHRFFAASRKHKPSEGFTRSGRMGEGHKRGPLS